VPASAPLSAAPPPPRRWLWPAVVAVLVAALAAALVYGGLGGDALRAVFDKGASSDGPRTAEELIRAQQLEQRLAQADQALADGRLLEPPLANALDLYRDVQRMDAGNAAAAAGIEKTAAAVLGKARAAAENNDFDGAYSLIATALVIKPDLEGVEDLREYIGQQKARVGARQQADARLGELLSAGQADLEAGRLAGSGTDNALARFRTVLVLDADNAQARAGINAVVEGLAAEGERLLEAGDLVEANRIVANLRGIDAGHPTTEAFAAEYETVAAEADAAKQDTARVDELLRAGDAALRANRLTSPAGNNALEKYRAVLKITPDNNRALAGVDAVVDKYAWLAEQAAVDGDTEQAERFLGKARGIAPGSARVRALEERLAADTERAAEAEREAEQARQLAEQERRQAEALAAAEAEAERKRRQEAEALRLLREAEQKAGIESKQREAEADARIQRVAIRYDGFETDYERYGLKVSELRQEFTEQLSNAGYRLLSYEEAVGDPNARLVLVYFRANLNTTTGMFSYATAIRLSERLPLRESSSKAFSSRPVWSKGDNGALRQSDLGRLNAVYRDLMTAFLRDNPGRR
ncbi:MAG: hypothetical protein KJO38_01955, partial [Gammaproteobacteria bacterium]|nr:hypothetical protein [Gammaproteobacteria bacterium]